MKNITLIVALACLAAPAFAEDEIDSRTKAVNDAYAQEIKQPESTLNAAKETAARAYQKYCRDKAVALEHAVANCEKKLKSAHEAGNKKSEEALTARLAELKDDLTTWKANADKKWDVGFEEKAGDGAQSKPRWFIGKWQWFDGGGASWVEFREDGYVYDTGGNKGEKWRAERNKVFLGSNTVQRIEMDGKKIKRVAPDGKRVEETHQMK